MGEAVALASVNANHARIRRASNDELRRRCMVKHYLQALTLFAARKVCRLLR
jgi:hypothetical protein